MPSMTALPCTTPPRATAAEPSTEPMTALSVVQRTWVSVHRLHGAERQISEHEIGHASVGFELRIARVREDAHRCIEDARHRRAAERANVAEIDVRLRDEHLELAVIPDEDEIALHVAL